MKAAGPINRNNVQDGNICVAIRNNGLPGTIAYKTDNFETSDDDIWTHIQTNDVSKIIIINAIFRFVTILPLTKVLIIQLNFSVLVLIIYINIKNNNNHDH